MLLPVRDSLYENIGRLGNARRICMKADAEVIPATMTVQNEVRNLVSLPKRELVLKTACMGERIVQKLG